jgi:prepilin-type N-terminal cleavage/methylation domain-containing protein
MLPRPAHRRRHARGFSLVEVIVALAILGIGILAFMRFFPLGLRNVQIAQERSAASELANDRLGRIQMAGPRQLELTGVFGSSYNLTNIIAAEAAYGNYVFEGFTTSVQAMPGSSQHGLKRVTFAVELPDGRRETFVTYISDM